MHPQDVLPEERQRAQPHVPSVPPDVGELFEVGEAVLHVPQEIREGQDEGEEAGQDEPPVPEKAPVRRGEEPDDHRGAEDEHRLLVLEAQAGEQAEEEPEAGLSGPDDARGHEGAAGPDQRLDGVHREVAVEDVGERGDDDRDGREGAGTPAASQLPGERGGQEDEAGAHQGGEEVQSGEPGAEENRGEARLDGRERRHVDVAEREMLAAGEEVEFVDERAVGRRGGEVEEGLQEGEEPDSRSEASSVVSRYGAVRAREHRDGYGDGEGRVAARPSAPC